MVKWLFLLLLLGSSTVTAQKEASNWVTPLGTFNLSGATPALSSFPALNTGLTLDANVTVSHCNGDLAFYSDRIAFNSVYRALYNAAMDSIGSSTAPGAGRGLIWTKSDSIANRLILYNTIATSIHKSILDYDPVTQNFILQNTNALVYQSSTGAITSTITDGNDQGKKWFLILSNDSVFRSLGVTSEGNVTSSISTSLHHLQGSFQRPAGILISPNGENIASRCQNTFRLELLKFNKQTGSVDDYLVIDLGIPLQSVVQPDFYLFSPNGNKLYVKYRTSASFGFRGIYQFDLSVWDSTAIRNSAVQINGANSDFLDFTYGPQGQLFLLGKTRGSTPQVTISTIEQPNLTYPACNLVEGLFSTPLIPGVDPTYLFKLPRFPAYLFNPARYSIVSEQHCFGDSTQFRLFQYENLDWVAWDFGDPANPGQLDSSYAPAHLYAAPGQYNVTAYVSYCNTLDTLQLSIRIQGPPDDPALPDTSFCAQGGPHLNLPAQLGNSVLWSSGDSSWSTSFSSPGWQWVEISNACFSTRDSFYVSLHEAPQSGLPADTNLCPGDVLLLTPAAGDYSWAWQDGSTVPLSVTESGTYALLMTNACGTFVHEVQVQFREAPVLALNDTSRCEGQFYRIELPDTWQGAYQWNDGSSERIRILTDSGWYSAQITNPCGTASDAFYLSLVDCACHMYLPTAFTPNGDGLNDQLVVITRCLLSDFQLEVYNRWGQQIFVSNDISRGWDGTYQGELLPPGSYPFLIRYVPEGRNARVEKGVVHLLR